MQREGNSWVYWKLFLSIKPFFGCINNMSISRDNYLSSQTEILIAYQQFITYLERDSWLFFFSTEVCKLLLIAPQKDPK